MSANNLISYFPKKIPDNVQGSFSHLFCVFAIKIELSIKRRSCFESDLGETSIESVSVSTKCIF